MLDILSSTVRTRGTTNVHRAVPYNVVHGTIAQAMGQRDRLYHGQACWRRRQVHRERRGLGGQGAPSTARVRRLRDSAALMTQGPRLRTGTPLVALQTALWGGGARQHI